VQHFWFKNCPKKKTIFTWVAGTSIYTQDFKEKIEIGYSARTQEVVIWDLDPDIVPCPPYLNND
jgi:hypothetical protein